MIVCASLYTRGPIMEFHSMSNYKRQSKGVDLSKVRCHSTVTVHVHKRTETCHTRTIKEDSTQRPISGKERGIGFTKSVVIPQRIYTNALKVSYKKVWRKRPLHTAETR